MQQQLLCSPLTMTNNNTTREKVREFLMVDEHRCWNHFFQKTQKIISKINKKTGM
jgi:hypothetical protein